MTVSETLRALIDKLQSDASGVPVSDLLRDVGDYLNRQGGGPMADRCLLMASDLELLMPEALRADALDAPPAPQTEFTESEIEELRRDFEQFLGQRNISDNVLRLLLPCKTALALDAPPAPHPQSPAHGQLSSVMFRAGRQAGLREALEGGISNAETSALDAVRQPQFPCTVPEPVDVAPRPQPADIDVAEILQAICRGTPCSQNRRKELQHYVLNLANAAVRQPELTQADIDQIAEGIEHFIMNGDPDVDMIWQPFVDKLRGVSAVRQPLEPRKCWYGHTTRHVGCVSCVIVFDRPAEPKDPT